MRVRACFFALFLFALVFHRSGVWSQGLPAAAGGSKSDPYAAESIVLERADVVYSMAADGTGWRQRTVVVRVQSEAAVKQLGVISIPFAGASERVELQYARVRRPDGTVVETPVADALEMPEEVTRQAPFYSDLKEKQIPIRNLRVGDTLEWQARIVRTKAEAPGEFWGQENFDKENVALEELVELRVPKGKAVKVWSPTLKPVESVVGDELVYRWTSSQLKTTAAQQAEMKTPWTAEQELDAKEGKLPAIAWTTFPNWEAVGAWYRGLEGDRIVPSAEVKAKVAEVTAGKTTEEEKVKAVYGYVATQVRYIGVAFGVGRYQPHTAAEVLENQYGDCKDKHTLLAAMLGALGVETDAVLIGAGIRFNPDVPSPEAFNHLITLATVDGKPVWLDTTAEVAPYQLLMYVIRDHKALVVPAMGVARVEQTPKELPFMSFVKMKAAGTLDKNGVAESKMAITLRGDDEVGVRAILRQVPPARYDELMQNMSRGMGYAGTTSHAELGRAEDTVEPLTMRYDYHREKPGDDWDHLRIITQLYPVLLPMMDEKEPPVKAIQLGVLRTETSNSEMKLPEGWSAELPEAIHAHSAYANFDETFRFEKGMLYAERKLEVLKESVPQADWKSYKKWADEADLSHEVYVQLIRGKNDAGSTSSSGSSGPAVRTNANAASLVTSAYSAIGRHELDAAEAQLDQAKALNDTQARLWSTYGYLAYQRGLMTDAIKDYEKELLLHPDGYGVYRSLADANINLGNNEEAANVLRRWAAAEPENPLATVALVNELLNIKDAAGAVKAAEAGIVALPEERRNDENLQLALGKAQARAGMKDAAGKTLSALLKSTENVPTLYGAAYELSQVGEQLEAAESGARTALAQMSDESKTWTLDENLETLRAKSQWIAALWDTLGWILYLEKKPDAEMFVNAAWMNHQESLFGEHRGQMLAARGDTADAIRTYKLALETISPYDGMVKRDKPTEVQTRLQEKLAELEKSVGKEKTAEKTGPRSLQELRTIPLGSAEGKNGIAEYKLLISASGVERVEQTGDKAVAGGEEMVKKLPLKGYIAEGSDARLVKSAFLNCHSAVCELVLAP